MEEGLHITHNDFWRDGKARHQKTPTAEHQLIAYCILCECRIKAIKLGKGPAPASAPPPPRKRGKQNVPLSALVKELQQLAAYSAHEFIFT
jgi:hypothetical protein